MVSRRTVAVAVALVAAGVAGLFWLPIEGDTTLTNAIVIERRPARCSRM